MDYRIELAGHQLWQDRDAIMWHRRRNPSRVRKQIRNYGLVRILASNLHPGMKSWSHTAVGLFPLLVLAALTCFGFGAFNGGLAWPNVGHIVGNGSNGIGTSHGPSPSQPRRVVCRDLLGWCCFWHITFTFNFNHIDGTIDDIPVALVLWNGRFDRMVENVCFQECRPTD